MTAANDPGEYRLTWQSKPVLRDIYYDYYRRIAAELGPGRTVEIGGGSGNLKEWATGIISTDVQFAPWLDLVADAHTLPFASGSIGNVVLFDVLHHLSHPRIFLEESARVLAPGGRLVLLEPAVTLGSWPFYHFFHPEPVRLGADPLGSEPLCDPADPWDANQAVPSLLFFYRRGRLREALPGLTLSRLSHLSLFAYPLSGGFKPWSLLPQPLVRPLLAIEDWLAPVLGPVMGFRLLAVLERTEG